MSITSIILTASASVMVLTAKVLPVSTDGPSSVLSASRALNQMSSELETATLILELSPTSITFLVPDRTGNLTPERIRYSWSGIAGAPLTRQYNGGIAATVIDSVNQFNVTPTVATNTESYPGIAVEDTSESLLMDYSSTAGAGNNNVSSNTWFGQLFASSSWPTGVVGWRPTRVQCMAKQGSLLGITNFQLRPASASLTPSSTILAQSSVLGTGLLSSFAWSSCDFGGMDRYAPSAGVCFVAAWSAGLPNSIVLEHNNLAGMVQTSDAGSTWSYKSGNALISQMYGTLSRSMTTQYALSKYANAISLCLRANDSSNPAVNTTAQTLNHPEILMAFWELKFNRDPTTVDANADGTADWAVNGGGSFNTSGLINGSWQTSSGTQLDSQAGDDFSLLTVVDVRFRALTSGSSAGVNLNAARSGSTCAPVLAQITLQSDGTQTLSVLRKIGNATTDTLLTIPQLPSTAVDLHLIIDPTAGTVGIRINNGEYGSFAYYRFNCSDTSRSVSLTSSGSAEFDYVRVREMSQ